MRTTIVPLIGDIESNLYQLGMREKSSFLKLEKRVAGLLSASSILTKGQDLILRVKAVIKKKSEQSFFERCLTAYAEGLGVDLHRYQKFISYFETAAHYGQVYPELKGLLPGCASIFIKDGNDITHTRILDFPLIDIFNETAKLYFWHPEGMPSVLSYSCEGLAPLFFQGVHASGLSFALHHKPGNKWHEEGKSIFEIAFESLLQSNTFEEVKRSLKKRASFTKWSYHLLNKDGKIAVLDIDGPSVSTANFDLNDASPVIFTNIPLQQDKSGSEEFLRFSTERQTWLRDKIRATKQGHILDIVTDVEDQKIRNWIHPGPTLSTVGAYHLNLSQGYIDLKEGSGALVKSDEIVRFSLENQNESSVVKPFAQLKALEASWKRASQAQAFFDQGDYDEAYHELQMARAVMPHPIWREIFSFYLVVWDFKFINNETELSLIYKELKKIKLPKVLKDQKLLLMMRFERKLNLRSTVSVDDISPHLQELFTKEKEASNLVFATWMKLLYPRLELLEIFSPYK